MYTLPLADGACGPAGYAILQIHPSLKCNLSCAHCYSDSGPSSRLTLDPAIVCAAIADAAEMGYKVVSVSGGEPLMYSGLEPVLRQAKALGMRTTITTNGFFTDLRRFERLAQLVDVLAISLDGPPEVHNRMRAHPQAFARMLAGLGSVRASGIAFGFIHTMTRSHWQQLPWVADFAAEQGAKLLQVHPLELVGRAQTQLHEEIADDEVLARAYVMAMLIAAKYADRFLLQIDLIYRKHLLENPALVYADATPGADATPAQRLGLLVLEPDGSVVPICYGFSHRYRLCNVLSEPLKQAWQDYQVKGLFALRRLCHSVWCELSAANGPLLSNWHDVICARSHGGKAIAVTAID